MTSSKEVSKKANFLSTNEMFAISFQTSGKNHGMDTAHEL